VTPQDIADAIREARGIRIDRRKIHLDEPIRHTGTYMVVVEVADELTATVKTIVVNA
jgi:large subunit ribosomal protein L9